MRKLLFKKRVILSALATMITFPFLVSCAQTAPAATTPTPASTPAASNQTTSTTATTDATTTTSDLTVSSFNPAAGTGAIPTTVVVVFSKSLGSNAGDTSKWSWSCTGGSTSSSVPTNVSVAGTAATVSLPALSGASAGASCTLSVAAGVTASDGTSLGRMQSAAYVLSSTATSQSAVGYMTSPAPNTPYTTSVLIDAWVYPLYGATPPAKIQLTLDNGIVLNTIAYTGPQLNPSQQMTNIKGFSNGNHVLHVNAVDSAGTVTADIASPLTINIQNLDPVTASLCSSAVAAGVNIGTPAIAGSIAVCQISGNSCPTGMKPAGYTETAASTCNGGSTTGCWTGGDDCTTGSHYWGTAGQESCIPRRYLACGPATKDGNTCWARVTKIGCVKN